MTPRNDEQCFGNEVFFFAEQNDEQPVHQTVQGIKKKVRPGLAILLDMKETFRSFFARREGYSDDHDGNSFWERMMMSVGETRGRILDKTMVREVSINTGYAAALPVICSVHCMLEIHDICSKFKKQLRLLEKSRCREFSSLQVPGNSDPPLVL